jgi:hypothetical protein
VLLKVSINFRRKRRATFGAQGRLAGRRWTRYGFAGNPVAGYGVAGTWGAGYGVAGVPVAGDVLPTTGSPFML